MADRARRASEGDVVFVMDCGCPAGPVLVASWAAEGWRCGSCGRRADAGERLVLGPGGAVPPEKEPLASPANPS